MSKDQWIADQERILESYASRCHEAWKVAMAELTVELGMDKDDAAKLLEEVSP